MNDGLVGPTRRFVDEVGRALAEVSAEVSSGAADRAATSDARWRHDAALEAFNLVGALVAVDGRLSDDELWALLGAFGPLLETRLAGATPDALRESGLLAGGQGFVAERSPLLEVLVAADARHGTRWTRTYHDAAIDLAFAVAALDLHTSRAELEGIEGFRAVLLQALAEASAGGGPPTSAAPGRHQAGDRRTDRGDDPAARAQPVGGEPGEALGEDPAVGTATTSPTTPPDRPRPLEVLLAELDQLIGLERVKHEVKLVTDLMRVQRIRAERGLPVLDQSRHLIFTGNPGTGKTTVARLLAQIYRTLGVVERGHLVESDRAGLVAGYVGQTAPLVTARFDEADEGVLLIDEAYSLVRGGERDFGREAIDTIVKLIEDRRDRIVVIMAGYPDEMDELIAANPGLRSRFPKVIHFPDYTTDDLLAILDLTGDKAGYRLDPGARARARLWLDAVPRDRGFGNGRTARNLFEHAVATHASRLADVDHPSDEQLTTLVADDIPMPGHGPVAAARR